jgi:hypothetical protein
LTYILPAIRIPESSAYKNNLFSTIADKSFTLIKNQNIQPWGTPHIILARETVVPVQSTN